jgi:hypothetical protein
VAVVEAVKATLPETALEPRGPCSTPHDWRRKTAVGINTRDRADDCFAALAARCVDHAKLIVKHSNIGVKAAITIVENADMSSLLQWTKRAPF